MKEIAPNTAKLIRETFNTDPRISRHIQFNQLAPALLGGGLPGAEPLVGLLGRGEYGPEEERR